MKEVTNAKELATLQRGDVIVSANYMDAYSRFDWGSGGTLLNVATGHKTSPAEIGPDFFPASVIYSAQWAAPPATRPGITG